MEQIISAGLEELNLSGKIPETAPARLAKYGQLLLEKNQVMNLTAIREPEGAARLHFLDCAALLNYCDFQGKTLIDVGTGAGFPGLALKIMVPTLDVTLLDSLNKRLDWLDEVSTALELEGVRTLHARAEEQALVKGYRDSFDFAAARAVADLRVLCELCLPYVKVGGQFLAMKSANSTQELEQAAHAVKLLGGRVADIKDYTVPGTEVTHRLIIIEKLAPTLKGYPRRWAKIQKEPL
ncbi:16S rRNA (guanine(527)-N(7))-methyltransferase RsmG [Flintibacter muris]|uniref:16S rRNA (guanine(527)-N(7))-methyltransferase RsmG n=1 Tax=Flintibacter muris TaxID=2941327 RepID=UPI00203C6450|nr:16S rRNA (guanine(527)-N(7))-methyltransferase RsmG [Flintibacter muris]